MSSKRPERARKYLSLIFRQIPGAIWATDRELRFTFVHGETPMLDAESSQQHVGQTLYDFVGSDEPGEPAVLHHLAALAGRSQAFAYERRGRTFAVVVDPLIDEGEIVGCVGVAVDVTERREEQRRLTRSEERLREAQRVAHVGSFEWELAGDVLTCSEELYRIYGMPTTDSAMPLDRVFDQVHPADRSTVRDIVLDAVRHGKPFAYDHRITRPDGHHRVIHTVGDVVNDRRGVPVRVAGSSWDVTEQHETTRQLQESVSLLSATLESTADGILVVDRAGKVSAHNHHFQEMWRIPPTLLARNQDEALLSYVSDQLEDPLVFRDKVRQLYAAPEQESFDVLRFKDCRVFERFSKPQLIGGRVVGRVWSFRDVTDRERLLQRATFLADATRLLTSLDIDKAISALAAIAVPYLGEQCVIDLLRNGTPQRFHGVDPGTHPLGDPDLHPRALAGHSVLYATGSRALAAVPLVCRDAVVGVITVVGADGRSYSRQDLEVLEELARRTALSMDNARLFEGARDALNSRDEFLSIAAHEIRGPLTAIHLATQALLRETLSSTATKSALETIQREDRRLGRFVDDLLDLGRLRTGQLHLTLEEVDLGTVIRNVVSRMAADCAEAGSAVTVSTSGDLVGHWDPVRLEQVMTNLLSNAIKFGKGKPVEIVADSANGRVRVRVTDHGIGIKPSMLTRIFHRFERAVEARHYGGLGLGLHIAKTIVEGLGGTLTVESQVGQGSTFTIDLPGLERNHERGIDHGRR
jgi:signal transduction histidine kinase/PAS domain-containing protein